MLCDICNINEATIHVQEIFKGKKRTLNICAYCASEHNLTDKDLDGFNIAEILYNISSKMLDAHDENTDAPDNTNNSFITPEEDLKCACGWTTDAFRKTGRLGCPACYKAFTPILRDALKSMHKGSFHTGKQPGTKTDRNGKTAMKIMALQKELDEYVRLEEYEKAAKIRDKISNLKKSSSTAKKSRAGGRPKTKKQ